MIVNSSKIHVLANLIMSHIFPRAMILLSQAKRGKSKLLEQLNGGLNIHHNCPNVCSKHYVYIVLGPLGSSQYGYQVHQHFAQFLRKCPDKKGPRNKLMLTIFVSFEAIIPKPQTNVGKMNEICLCFSWEVIFLYYFYTPCIFLKMVTYGHVRIVLCYVQLCNVKLKLWNMFGVDKTLWVKNGW